MNVRRLGGAYGVKISRNIPVACASALAAHLLNRPVRFVMKLEANMTALGKRYGCISNYEVQVDGNGTIQKLKNNYIEDYGCSLNEPVISFSRESFKNCYSTKNWVVNPQEAITDSASNTWCRAFGTLEGIAMIENIMDHIAYTIEKDPIEVRLANCPKSSKIRGIISDFMKSVDFYERKQEVDNFNEANRWIKRGIAVMPMKYHLEYLSSKNALVSIYREDGSVSITHGGIEMGQGMNTKVAQTAAHTLEIPLYKIQVKPTNNLTSPNAQVSGGSQSSDTSCFGVQKACEILNSRLKPIKKANPSDTWEEIIQKAYATNIDLMATYFYKPTDLKEYDIWGVTCCEVEVDILTGNFQIKRVDILEDVGESISPGIDIGQIEGAFVMGLGYWLTEELIYDRNNGELLTNRTWNYKPPGAKDIPIDFRISFLQNSSNPFGVLRSKATGEPAACMSYSVIMALRHAINSARNDSTVKSEEYYHLGAPTTAEYVFLAAKNSTEQFLLD